MSEGECHKCERKIKSYFEFLDKTYTGWGLISEIKYGLTVTLICVLVTFQAYWGLTRCAPFDKICLSNFLEPF